MQRIFLELVKLSLLGSLFAAGVMLVRLIFRKAPKWLFCVLWGVVALRLICPVSIESKVSLVPERVASGQFLANVAKEYIGDVEIIYESNAGYSNAVEAGRQPMYSNEGYYVVTEKNSLEAPKTVGDTVFPVLSWIWVAGMVLMLAYTVASYLVLRKKMEEATHLRDNVWQCEQVDSPFVLGFLKPSIYLPYTLTDADMANVIAHERAHIRRKDHWWKPMGFLLLSVHWFNPVLWLAYVLLCRDIEAACDEKVIKHMEKEEMRAYSTALLNCSVHRRRIAACPLAFGETGVKERIKHVMRYKKPTFWIILFTVAASIVIGVLLLTNPAASPKTIEGVPFPFTLEQVRYVEMFRYKGDPNGASKKNVTEADDIKALYEKFRSLTLYQKSVNESSEPEVTSFRFRLKDGSDYELIYYGYGVKKGRLVSQTGGFDYFTSADIGWNWRWLNEALISVPADIKELPAMYPDPQTVNDILQNLMKDIVYNKDCAASSNPFAYIEAGKTKYNEILTYGEEAVELFVQQIRVGENGLREYIMAVACADITGIGDKYDGADWATAQQWLALYDSSEHDIIVPKLIAEDYISGRQAKLQSFGYSLSKGGEEPLAAGVALWMAAYSDDETLVLDGKNGQNLIRLAPQGFSLHHYKIYLPDGTLYDDGTRTLHDALSPMAQPSDQGICLTAPAQAGEYYYELELAWPEKDLSVSYGLKIVMTGKESDYDRALESVFAKYGEGNPLISVSLVDHFVLANAVYRSHRYVFRIENIPNAPIWVEVAGENAEITGEFKQYDVLPPYVDFPLGYFDSGPAETIQGNLKTYYRNTDGTWQVDGRNYKYRLEITGRMKNAAVDSTFVYLSNLEVITFDQAWKAAGYSSNKADYFDVEDAVLVEWLSGEPDR